MIIRAHRFVVSQGLYQLVGLGSLLYSSVGVYRFERKYSVGFAVRCPFGDTRTLSK